MSSPLSNKPLRRSDALISSVREVTERRSQAIWEGIPSSVSGAGAFDNPKDLRVEPGSTGVDTAAWDRTDPGEFTGVTLYLERIAWDTDLGKLVAFKRELLIDSRGMIVSIGPEAKVDLDTGENCT